MKVHSFKVKIGEAALKAFLTKNDRWGSTEVEIVYNEGDVPRVQSMSASTLQIFLLEQKLCDAGVDETLLEEYGQLRYAEGHDEGYDSGSENACW